MAKFFFHKLVALLYAYVSNLSAICQIVFFLCYCKQIYLECVLRILTSIVSKCFPRSGNLSLGSRKSHMVPYQSNTVLAERYERCFWSNNREQDVMCFGKRKSIVFLQDICIHEAPNYAIVDGKYIEK